MDEDIRSSLLAEDMYVIPMALSLYTRDGQTWPRRATALMVKNADLNSEDKVALCSSSCVVRVGISANACALSLTSSFLECLDFKAIFSLKIAKLES